MSYTHIPRQYLPPTRNRQRERVHTCNYLVNDNDKIGILAFFSFLLLPCEISPYRLLTCTSVKLDIVSREQTLFAAKVAEPPVVVGEFLRSEMLADVQKSEIS
jgi:hypothetical protein